MPWRAILGRLVEHAVALDRLDEGRHIAVLLHLEGVEARAQQKQELIAQHLAGGAKLAAKAISLAQHRAWL